MDSLTRLALEHLETALVLRADTSPEDLVRLAVLRLTADDIAGSEELLESALGAYLPATPDGPLAGSPPAAAANLYLATGRPGRAFAILQPTWATRTFGVMDPDTPDDVLMAGPVEPQFGQILAYGSTGVTGEPLDSLFRAIEDVWSEPAYSGRQRAALSHASLQLGIGPALASRPEVLARWVAGWREADLAVPAVFQGLAAAQLGSASVGEWLDSTVVEIGEVDRVSPSRLFLAATLAARAGSYSLAADLYGRVRACPLRLDNVDLGWGLRTQSFLYEGIALSVDRGSAGCGAGVS